MSEGTRFEMRREATNVDGTGAEARGVVSPRDCVARVACGVEAGLGRASES